jgi:hypothetical protein
MYYPWSHSFLSLWTVSHDSWTLVSRLLSPWGRAIKITKSSTFNFQITNNSFTQTTSNANYTSIYPCLERSYCVNFAYMLHNAHWYCHSYNIRKGEMSQLQYWARNNYALSLQQLCYVRQKLKAVFSTVPRYNSQRHDNFQVFAAAMLLRGLQCQRQHEVHPPQLDNALYTRRY